MSDTRVITVHLGNLLLKPSATETNGQLHDSTPPELARAVKCATKCMRRGILTNLYTKLGKSLTAWRNTSTMIYQLVQSLSDELAGRKMNTENSGVARTENEHGIQWSCNGVEPNVNVRKI